MLLKIKLKLLSIAMQVGSFLFGYQSPPLPSVSAIIKRNKKILVIDLSYKKGYALPGGVLKGNEDYESAIKREVKEETGLKISSLKYFGSYCVTDPYSKVNITYIAKVKGKVSSSKEGKAVWKDPSEIKAELTYKDNKKAIKEWLNK